MIRGQGETERKEVLKLGSWEDGKMGKGTWRERKL